VGIQAIDLALQKVRRPAREKRTEKGRPMKFTPEQVIEMARESGIEVHDRKQQARIGLAALAGLDSTAELTRLCTLAADRALEAAAQKVAPMGHWTGGHGEPRTPRPEECATAIRAMKEQQ
jgi:hypothetical protein